ncbi:MAG: M3 family metallopeptidase [Flavobacteriaceae bacterium]|nr:M3 family metallopeptidase [Flavobacteriaceae bacterium]
MNKKLILFIFTSVIALTSCKTENKTSSTEKQTDSKMTENPLLAKWDTPFGVPPFDKIKSENYLPAMREAIKRHKIEIATILNNKEKPTFKNTVEALELSGADLTKVANVFFAVNGANTNDILKETNKIIGPELTAHGDEITLNSDLFKRIKSVYNEKNNLELTAEEMHLLKETYEGYIRAGVNVEGKNKERLKEINKKLATLSINFSTNLLDETNDFEIHTNNKEDLGDLAESLVALAAVEAKKRGHDTGWSFTLQRPSINPFLQTSPNREMREKLFQGYTMRGDNDNTKDNKAILSEMASLRVEKANLLGSKTWADNVLSNRMAANAKNVYDLLDKLWPSALAMAKKDRTALAEMMKKEGIKSEFRGSDWRYYVAKVRAKRYDFNEDETRPYFEFNNVREGAFKLAYKLFGMTFKPLNDVPKWHEDQQVFEVLENGKHLGVIYMDFFARESKRGGAWMNSLRNQSNVNGFVTPIVTNNFNYPAPTKNQPSLLSFTEAQTVFHEFGHALHGLLSNVKYKSLSGTNVPRDFVEFPSQVMENWMSEPEVLATYAKHYKTGEVIPNTLIEKMNKANNFDEGFRTVEYMAAAYLDMNWHTLTDTKQRDARKFEREAMQKIGLIDEILPRYRSNYYSHIFSGGYSAGYYSYLWSEVLDADTFNEFKKTGNIFDPELAKKYRKMLASGGTKSGMDLYKEFLGREPIIEPLLKKKGF